MDYIEYIVNNFYENLREKYKFITDDIHTKKISLPDINTVKNVVNLILEEDESILYKLTDDISSNLESLKSSDKKEISKQINSINSINHYLDITFIELMEEELSHNQDKLSDFQDLITKIKSNQEKDDSLFIEKIKIDTKTYKIEKSLLQFPMISKLYIQLEQQFNMKNKEHNISDL